MSDDERRVPPPGGGTEEPRPEPPPEGGGEERREPPPEAEERTGKAPPPEEAPAAEAPGAGERPAAGGAEKPAAAVLRPPATPAAPPPAPPPARPAAPPRPAPEDLPPWERDAATPEWVEAGDDPLAEVLRQRFGPALLAARTYAGTLTFDVAREAIAEVGRFLKQEQGYTYLVDVCGADYPEREERFDVVYHLHSFDAERRIRLKVTAGEDTPVPSVAGVWRAANWSEREAYDMYGIRFDGHPDLTRILLWEGFNGYPLRKDFPVEGIDTGSAIYPEYYEAEAGPVAGTGTGWKAPKPPVPEPPAEPSGEAN